MRELLGMPQPGKIDLAFRREAASPMYSVLRTLVVGTVGLSFTLLRGSALLAGYPQAEAEHTTLAWEFESSHSALSTTDSAFYLRVRIRAAEIQSDRPPVNLALVFDRSGSMKEDAKIGFLRQAGHLVVDNLTKQDHVAVVAYNHQVQTLVPLHPTVNREYLHHRIDELSAEGFTNLSGGLLEGCAQLQARLNQPGLHHVILLTDGMANRGVTDANALARLIERCTQNGVTVSTIGVGTEYNEALLSRMADAGGGRYTYVARPDDIPAALDRELGALLTVVAQNTQLAMELPAGMQVIRVFGREESMKPGNFELPLGDFASGEERVLLVKLQRSLSDPGAESVDFPLTLTYDETSSAQRVRANQVVSIPLASAGDSAAAQPSAVLAYARLVEAVDKIGLAVQGMDRQLAAETQRFLQREFGELKEAAQSSHDQDFVNKAFLFEHYSRELQVLIDRGALHEHSAERAALQKELHYRSYLLDHHRQGHRH